MIERVAGEEVRHRLGEDLFEGDIEAANGPVEVDRPEEVRADFDEVNQRGEPAGVDGEPGG